MRLFHHPLLETIQFVNYISLTIISLFNFIKCYKDVITLINNNIRFHFNNAFSLIKSSEMRSNAKTDY